MKQKQTTLSQIIYMLCTCILTFSCASTNNHTPINKIIDTTVFNNPILNQGADPWVIKNGDEYFVTFTTGSNITLMRTDKMSNLSHGSKKVIWTPPTSGLNSKNIWAPELHKINDVWYVHYAADDGNNVNHRMWILENTSEDPFTGTWVDRGELKLPDDKWVIDGEPFELNGEYYYIWSGWEGDTDVQQNIYIAKMKDPLTVVGERICIVKPIERWEHNNRSPKVSEGPQFIKKDNKVFVFYSAGACWTDGYSLGYVWMDALKNPLDLKSWTKGKDNPVFISNREGNAFGPGHNSFFKSKDGKEDWILYHANPKSGLGCGGDRSVRMQKFTWDFDGFPILGKPKPLSQKLLKPSGE